MSRALRTDTRVKHGRRMHRCGFRFARSTTMDHSQLGAAGRRRLLAASPFFASFPERALDLLAGHLVERRFADRQTIFTRGDPGSSMMLVADGRVRIGLTSPEGREVLLALLGPGQLFGELALLDGRPRSADAMAHGPCRILVLDRRDFLPMLRRSPEASRKLFELVCARLRAANDQLEGAALLTVETRLARALLRLARAGTGGRRVPELTQTDLGRLIGASRQEVNRHLRQWLGDGVLGEVDRRLVILDPPALARLAGCPGRVDQAVGNLTGARRAVA